VSDWAPTGETFDDVVVVPYSDLLDRWRDGEIHRGGPIWPEWEEQVAARHGRGGRPIDVRPPDPEVPILDAGPMAWGGAIVDAFGHQVADFSARLLATLQARPDLPIAFASRPDLGYADLASAPGYFRAILEWLGVAPDRVRIVTAPTRPAELFVAPQAEQLSGPGPGTAYLDALDAHADERLGPSAHDGGLLYVSRAGMEARFAGEPYLEELLRAAGVRVLRPETLALAEQLRSYRAAAALVFAEGSALHALQLLGHIGAEVDVLERRRGTRLVEANLRPRVRRLAYQEVATKLVHGILPSGRPALPKGLSVAEPERLIEAFARRGVELRRSWDGAAWAAARDADVLRWTDTQAAEPGHLGAGSVEGILEGLLEAGLGHLVDDASVRLEPLRQHLAASVRTRAVGAPTLLFMHIPRSGGGSVRSALHDAIPPAERRDVYTGTAMDRSAFAALPDEERSSLTAVIGDFDFGLHEVVPGPARYAVMLRHPISRVLSLYRAAGKPATLESWVFDDRRVQADNAMVRAISGRANVPFGACPDDMLDEAVAHIEAYFEAVLIRGNMRRSAVVLGQAMGLTLPPFEVVNADPAGEDSFDPPKPLRKRLRQLNRLDVELFKRYAEGF
jgi:hypothetical protein